MPVGLSCPGNKLNLPSTADLVTAGLVVRRVRSLLHMEVRWGERDPRARRAAGGETPPLLVAHIEVPTEGSIYYSSAYAYLHKTIKLLTKGDSGISAQSGWVGDSTTYNTGTVSTIGFAKILANGLTTGLRAWGGWKGVDRASSPSAALYTS